MKEQPKSREPIFKEEDLWVLKYNEGGVEKEYRPKNKITVEQVKKAIQILHERKRVVGTNNTDGISRVSGEPPKPDRPIEDAKSMLDRFRDKHYRESRNMGGSFNGLDRIPFVVDKAIELMAEFMKIGYQHCLDDLENDAKELTGGSVPTPSDEDVSKAALTYQGMIGGNRSDACSFTEGVTWVKEWLRDSTEQRLGKEGDKG